MAATAASCSVAVMVTGTAPKLVTTSLIRVRSPSEAPSVQRIQEAPRNSAAEAACGPACSRPAIGWPPTKWARCWAARTTGSLTPATSVTSASVASPARSATTAPGGPASTTRSAGPIASLRLSADASIPSSSRASARTARLGSPPVTTHPAARSASPTEVPIRPVPRMAAAGTRSDLEVEGSRQAPDVIHQRGELGRKQSLGTVDQCGIRGVVHVDHESVGSDRHGCPAQRGHQVTVPGGVGRVDHHRKVGQTLQHRDGTDVEGVPSGCLESSDTSLDHDDFVVALFVYVLGGVEPFLHRGGEATLELDGSRLFSPLGQQREIGHVAGSHPEKVRIRGHQLYITGIEHLSDEGHVKLVTGFGKQLQPFFAHTLEGIR